MCRRPTCPGIHLHILTESQRNPHLSRIVPHRGAHAGIRQSQARLGGCFWIFWAEKGAPVIHRLTAESTGCSVP